MLTFGGNVQVIEMNPSLGIVPVPPKSAGSKTNGAPETGDAAVTRLVEYA